MFLQLDDTLSLGEYEVHASGCHQHPTDIIGVHREQDDLGLRHHAFEHDRCFRPVQQWHGKVEQNQIRLKLLCFLYGIRAIFRFPQTVNLVLVSTNERSRRRMLRLSSAMRMPGMAITQPYQTYAKLEYVNHSRTPYKANRVDCFDSEQELN